MTEPNDLVLTPVEIVQNTKELAQVNSKLSYLESILETSFTPEKIKGLLADLCEASDVVVTKEGDTIQKPNWDARKNGLDRVLKLLKYTNQKDMVEGTLTPTKIVFNIVNEAPK